MCLIVDNSVPHTYEEERVKTFPDHEVYANMIPVWKIVSVCSDGTIRSVYRDFLWNIGWNAARDRDNCQVDTKPSFYETKGKAHYGFHFCLNKRISNRLKNIDFLSKDIAIVKMHIVPTDIRAKGTFDFDWCHSLVTTKAFLTEAEATRVRVEICA